MFVNVTRVARRRPLHPDNLFHLVARPQGYWSTSIAEYLTNQETIEFTGMRIGRAKAYKGSALVTIDTCYYRQTRDLLSEEEIDSLRGRVIEKYAQKGLDRGLTQGSPEFIAFIETQMDYLMKEVVDQVHNGELYDAGGAAVARVYCDKDIADETRLYNAKFRQDPGKFRSLVEFNLYRNRMQHHRGRDPINGLLVHLLPTMK